MADRQYPTFRYWIQNSWDADNDGQADYIHDPTVPDYTLPKTLALVSMDDRVQCYRDPTRSIYLQGVYGCYRR